jgi:type II secretory pathway component HofQ
MVYLNLLLQSLQVQSVEYQNDSLPIADTVIIQELSVRNTEIRDLLQGLAVQYGLNLYMDKEVSGSVSVNLIIFHYTKP